MRVRILFGEMPRMMCDIFSGAIESQADMAIVGQCANRELDVAIRQHDANVVILGRGDASSDDVGRQLLLMHPHLKAIVIKDEGRGASLFEFRHLELIEPSPAALLDAIRAAVYDEWGRLLPPPPE